MSLTDQQTRQYYDQVDAIITRMNSRLTWIALCSDLYHLNNPIPDQELYKKECKTYYGKGQMENLAWSVSLGLMSWVLHNFKSKAEKDHCHNITTHKHGDITPRNCDIGREFHAELYNKCLKTFKDAIDVFEKILQKHLKSVTSSRVTKCYAPKVNKYH